MSVPAQKKTEEINEEQEHLLLFEFLFGYAKILLSDKLLHRFEQFKKGSNPLDVVFIISSAQCRSRRKKKLDEINKEQEYLLLFEILLGYLKILLPDKLLHEFE